MAHHVEVTKVIAATPERVYELVSDLPRMGEWSPENTGGSWIKGATGPAVGAKFKTPYQFVVSVARAADAPVGDLKPLLGALNKLGMPLYGCPTPDGYKNTQEAWLNPDALSRRIAYATAAGQALDAGALQLTLGSAISPRTRLALTDSPERLRAAMLLGSPDFMQH